MRVKGSPIPTALSITTAISLMSAAAFGMTMPALLIAARLRVTEALWSRLPGRFRRVSFIRAEVEADSTV